MNDLVRDLLRAARFRPTTVSQRFAYVCGVLLILSGLLHGVVYLIDGGPWTGPVSWRKPVVFGLSFGITLVTLSWFMSFLRPHRIIGWLVLGILSLTSLAEVFLISMQKWRGVASHFNENNPFDASVFSMMGLLVTVIVVVTAVIAVWSFLRMDAPASLAWAIRAGLVLMLLSQAVGVQMIIEGGNTFGAAGAMKLPHALTLHAVQVLPLLAVVLAVCAMPERRRLQVVAIGGLGYVGLIGATMLQTYTGRGPLEVTVLITAIAAAGFSLLVASAVIALRALASRQRLTRPASTDRAALP